MARYTEKTKADLGWNEIRRTVTYIANLRAAEAKERALNRILPALQDDYEAALNAGTILELGPEHLHRVEMILAEELDGVLS